MFCPSSSVPRAGSWLKSQPPAHAGAWALTALRQQSGSSAGTGVGMADARVALCWAVTPAKAPGSESHVGATVVVVVDDVVLVVVGPGSAVTSAATQSSTAVSTIAASLTVTQL